MAKKENVKKPLYKKWWFWVIVVCLVGAIGSSLSGGSDADKSADPSTAQTEPHAPVQNQETVETPKPHPVESTPESDPVETMPEAEGQNGNASDGTFGDIYGIITTNGLRTIKRLGKSKIL